MLAVVTLAVVMLAVVHYRDACSGNAVVILAVVHYQDACTRAGDLCKHPGNVSPPRYSCHLNIPHLNIHATPSNTAALTQWQRVE